MTLDCKTCDYYEEYKRDGYVMKCNSKEPSFYLDTLLWGCTQHTKENKQANLEVKPPQVIECTKCGHEMRVVDE